MKNHFVTIQKTRVNLNNVSTYNPLDYIAAESLSKKFIIRLFFTSHTDNNSIVFFFDSAEKRDTVLTDLDNWTEANNSSHCLC